MRGVARIVLAVESEHLAQDVIDFLDRTGRARVVDSVRDPSAVAAVVERERPDAVVGSPALAPTGAVNGTTFLAVATEESVRSLRQALDAGAHGFFLWPGDRTGLLAAASRAVRPQVGDGTKRATVVAVFGPRGGVGTTFVATHLAAELARAGKAPILVDADAGFGDLTWALGVPDGAEVRTLADLEPVHDEISEEHVRNVLWPHPSGLRALLASPEGDGSSDPERHRQVVDACATLTDVVVLHLPRSLDATVIAACELASRLLMVITLDVFAFRAAKRAMGAVERAAQWDVVVNRAAHGSIVPADVERVFGRRAAAVLPFDRRVGLAQDRGELAPERSPARRGIRRLTDALFEETT
jgi:pilus assembly protein CpaE